MIRHMQADEGFEMLLLLNEEEEARLRKRPIPSPLPILAVRNTVLFPGVIIPVTVGREKSMQLIRQYEKQGAIIGVVAQKEENIEEPGSNDLFEIGTAAQILKKVNLPNGQVTIVLQGLGRFRVLEYVQDTPYFMAEVAPLPESEVNTHSDEAKALKENLLDAAQRVIQLHPELSEDAYATLSNIESFHFLVNFLSVQLQISLSEKQRLLEEDDIIHRGMALLEQLLKNIQLLELKNEIQKKVHSDLDKQQRDYYLRQQIKVLQHELGYEHEGALVEEFKEKAAQMKWSKEMAQHFDKEVNKLLRLAPGMPEYGIQVNYLELLLDLPWGRLSQDKIDLQYAKKILDQDHYGLEKVKERILEFLAVMKLKSSLQGPILCLYGPPGVGKTSLGKSIAKALGREYVRMSLGGLHDEAEIRGHRKTYIGAMPGKIIQLLRRAGTSNPVFVLDEIDKIGSDFRGDPASALLEVLDPEQNNAFVDNFLEVPFDLSKVLFIATANTLDTLHPALRDRMEIIELTGYTIDEKLEIAKQYLVPKQREANGLSGKQVRVQENALLTLIEEYTRESGVRQLERQVGSLMRKVAKAVAMEEEYPKLIKSKDVYQLLGKPPYHKELSEENLPHGVAIGLAWTPVGGDILYIESLLTRGKGKLTLSGRLGEVMKESASTAFTLLKSQAETLNIDYRLFEEYDLHIHVPEGAIPKDGPSAGITIFTSLASLYLKKPVRSNLAMTAEITLRGRVLPVGGIKEKLLAAQRAGIEEVILCEANQKDVEEIKSPLIKKLKITYVRTAQEVLKHALQL
ncbi:ATP-dependent Lon protease [Thermonema lapsum]|uniref:Lon protease n=1 Tax=Thermonema lapsum TaxID=28195 RepID=A0A846MTS0_9BACT|nr:endopeptidase La [Thermonema lapsum]NIK74849.1 ATP-dependent Lon protease [Thermonema lapsum]